MRQIDKLLMKARPKEQPLFWIIMKPLAAVSSDCSTIENVRSHARIDELIQQFGTDDLMVLMGNRYGGIAHIQDIWEGESIDRS